MFDNYCLILFTCRFTQFLPVIRQTLQSITKSSLSRVEQLKNPKTEQLCLLPPKDRKSINQQGFAQLRWNQHINRVSVANQVLLLSITKISVSDQQTQQKRRKIKQRQRRHINKRKERITLTKSKNTKRRQITTNPFLVQLLSMLH